MIEILGSHGNRSEKFHTTCIRVSKHSVIDAGNIIYGLKDEAKKILNIQSGNTVSILTCMIYKSSSFVFTDLSSTDYVFDKFDEDDLNSYINSGEWKGKAGACMVEGFCKKYNKEIRGLESCARGLLIEKLLPFIRYQFVRKRVKCY